MTGKALIAAFLLVFGASFSASADVINVSLNTQDWEKVAYYPDYQTYGTSMATVVNTVDSHLRGTKTTGTGGTNWFLGIHTVDSYDLQDAILRYKWLVNGRDSFSAHWNGADNDAGYIVYNQDPNPPYAGHLSTGWSWAGSEIIPSSTWFWTQLAFSETSYTFSISKSGYGGSDFLFGTKAIGTTTWAALGAAHPFFQIGDNYNANAYFEVAEMTIITRNITPEPSAPEPGMLALLAVGLAGLAGVRRRKGR
jgi:hypothetical protein